MDVSFSLLPSSMDVSRLLLLPSSFSEITFYGWEPELLVEALKVLPCLKFARQHVFLKDSFDDFPSQFKREFVALCARVASLRSAPEHSSLTIHLDVLFEDLDPDFDSKMYNHRDDVSANTDKLLREAQGPRGVQSGAGAGRQNVCMTRAVAHTHCTVTRLWLHEMGAPGY